jgi:hypothetical protein
LDTPFATINRGAILYAAELYKARFPMVTQLVAAYHSGSIPHLPLFEVGERTKESWGTSPWNFDICPEYCIISNLKLFQQSAEVAQFNAGDATFINTAFITRAIEKNETADTRLFWFLRNNTFTFLYVGTNTLLSPTVYQVEGPKRKLVDNKTTDEFDEDTGGWSSIHGVALSVASKTYKDSLGMISE